MRAVHWKRSDVFVKEPKPVVKWSPAINPLLYLTINRIYDYYSKRVHLPYTKCHERVRLRDSFTLLQMYLCVPVMLGHELARGRRGSNFVVGYQRIV